MEKISFKKFAAPLDEKNVMTDWIEEIFDDYSAIRCRRMFLGYIQYIPVYAKYSGNQIVWKVVDGTSSDVELVIEVLKKRLLEHEDPERDLFSEFKISGSTLTQTFWWKGDE